MKALEARVAEAVRAFWGVRRKQALSQGSGTRKDQGERKAVTGGAHIDGFIRLVGDLLLEAGLGDAALYAKTRGSAASTKLPGFFRATKDWDLLMVADGELVASMEFKSQVGPSFGNNCNNRVEEALGNATDLWTAYRGGGLQPIVEAVARLLHAARRSAGIHLPGEGPGAPLQGAPRVP